MPVTIAGANGVNGVLASVRDGQADIGFLAYDPVRAKEVDYSQTYALAQNTYLVLDGSPLRSIAEIDRQGMKIGVTEGDTADLVLTRTLKTAELWRNKGGDMEAAFRALQSREIAAYATNRQRLHELTQRHAGLRLLAENFYGVEQSIIVKKGNTRLLETMQTFLDDARTSGLTASAIARSGIVGLDVAPPRAQQNRAQSRQTDLKEPSAAYRWNIMLLLAASQAIAYIDRVNLSVAGPEELIKVQGYTPTELGFLLSVFNWAFTASLLLAGPFADWARPRLSFPLGVGVWSLATALCSVTTAFAPLAMFRAFVGIGESADDPVGRARDPRDLRSEAPRARGRHVLRRQQSGADARHPALRRAAAQLGLAGGVLHHRRAGPAVARVVACGLSRAAARGRNPGRRCGGPDPLAAPAPDTARHGA